MEAAPFIRIARHRRGENAIRPEEAGQVLHQYLTGVEKLNAYLDTFTL
jgi:hypothetical protein